jgi:hypothetical protein
MRLALLPSAPSEAKFESTGIDARLGANAVDSRAERNVLRFCLRQWFDGFVGRV